MYCIPWSCFGWLCGWSIVFILSVKTRSLLWSQVPAMSEMRVSDDRRTAVLWLEDLPIDSKNASHRKPFFLHSLPLAIWAGTDFSSILACPQVELTSFFIFLELHTFSKFRKNTVIFISLTSSFMVLFLLSFWSEVP